MKKLFGNKCSRRIISLLTVFALLLCSTITDLEMFSGIFAIDTVSQADASVLEADDTILLNSETVPDAALLQYLKSEVLKADSSLDSNLISVKDLAQKVTGALVIPAGVQNVAGLGWARSASSIDLSACSLVTEIKAEEFYNCSMTKVQLPTSVKKIGNKAFQNCANLSTINLGNVNEIGDLAFANCSALNDTSVASMQTTLTYLGNNAFQACKAITTAKVPVITDSSNAHSVPTGLFTNCASLAKVKFCDSSLKQIKDLAFNGTGALTFTTGTTYGSKLPASVNYIGISAFMGSGIKNLDLSNTSITEIKETTFSQANLSQSFVFPGNLEKIGKAAFESSAITRVVMPESVVTLGERCFSKTFSLAHIEMSPNITVIPVGAFQGTGSPGMVEGSVSYSGTSSGIAEFSFTGDAESKLTTIEDAAFNCSAVSDDTFLKNLKKLTSIGKGAFSYTDFVKLTIPACVEELGDEAFRACSLLTEVEFAEGSNVTELPKNCFGDARKPASSNSRNMIYSCINLKKVTLPAEVTKIGDYCFANCYALTTVGAKGEIAEGKVNFPNSLLEIGSNAFASASSYDTTSYSGITYYFQRTLEIPDGGISDVTIPDSVQEIGEAAFANNITLNSLKIGSALKSIPANMCSGCGAYPSKLRENAVSVYDKDNDEYNPIAFIGLKKLTLSNNLEEIGNNAFYQCYALESSENWNLPTNLKTIGNNAFFQCKSLNSVVFNSALTTIGDSAFESAAQGPALTYKSDATGKSYNYVKEFAGLHSVKFDFATKLTSLGKNAFKNTNITNISFPNALKMIPDSVCDGCYNLERVDKMAVDVTSVGSNAFRNCYKLGSVVIPFSATWAKNIFDGITANNDKRLTLTPAKSVESANVINGQETNLAVNCFKNFSSGALALTVTDAEKDPSGDNNLIGNDINDFVNVSSANSTITLFGKQLGNTQIKVTGIVNLIKDVCNADEVTISLSQTYDVTVTELPIDRITLTATGMTEEADEKVKYISLANTAGIPFKASYEPANTTETLGWTTSTANVVSVSDSTVANATSTVTVKPMAVGDTTLTVASPTKSESCVLKVRVPASTVKLPSSSMLLSEGQSYNLQATLSYDEGKYGSIDASYRDVCKFTSDKPEIVSVDYDTGRVLAVGVGTAVITAKTLASGASATCKITVKTETLLDSMVLSSTGMEVENGNNVMYMTLANSGGKSFVAEYTPKETTEQITWSVDNPSIVSLSSATPVMYNGKSTVTVKPITPGETVLHAKSGNLEQTCIIRINIPASSVKFDTSSATVATGATYALNAIVSYDSKYAQMAANCPDPVQYTSANPNIATVDPNTGLVQTLAAGTAKITAKCQISGKSVTFTLTVKDNYKPPITSFKMSETEKEMKVGESATLSVAILPADADQQVSWKSSSPDVVSVENGSIKAVKVGSATITATGANSKSATCRITVKSPAKGLKIRTSSGNTSKLYMVKGTSVSLDRYYSNADCSDRFEFSTKKNKYGTVGTSGAVSAKKPGKFVVTITSYNGNVKTSSSKITVYVLKKAVKAKKVKISGKKTVKVGKQLLLTAKLTSTKATDTISWISNKPKIATVSRSGVVKGLKKGTVTITAKTSNNKKATLKVKVK